MVKYFYHDGAHMFIVPHFATPKELAGLFDTIRPAAIEAMKAAGQAHAIYGTKHYDPETGALVEADVYNPAIVLDDAEFYRRTEEHSREHPGDVILAVHAMK